MLALLVVTPSLAEVLAEAERLDLRDLSEYEISWLEGVSVRTVRDWRLRGTGPNDRHGGGVRYPIRWYLEWREANRARSCGAEAKTAAVGSGGGGLGLYRFCTG